MDLVLGYLAVSIASATAWALVGFYSKPKDDELLDWLNRDSAERMWKKSEGRR